MFFLPVAYFVGKHCNSLITVHFLQQRIVKYYPFDLAYAGKIGIRMRAPFRCIHLKYPAYFYTDLLYKLFNLILKRFILNGREFIEKRFNNIRRYIHDKNTENKKKSPYPYPPVIRTCADQP